MTRTKNIHQTLWILMLLTTLGISANAVSTSGAIACDAHPDETQALVNHTPGAVAPLFDNLGTHTFPISTEDPLVQRYVNQGLILAYGFNHAEAFRSFQYAAELDPTCAMCYWGIAYVLGPNINAAMDAGAIPTAWESIQQAIAHSADLDGVTIWDIHTTAHLLTIATEVLAGEIAAKQGDFEGAIAHLQTGVELEGQLTYSEPSSWYAPVYQTLGKVLLQAGRYAEAEQAYQADLEIYPNNGWSLYGLAQSLAAQGKMEAAAAVQRQFEAVWQNSDTVLWRSPL
jgi:tetratricopeptide (TPR) repeat protein